MHATAAVALSFMILLTVADDLRSFESPSSARYELVALSGAVIGFSILYLMGKGTSMSIFLFSAISEGEKIFNLNYKRPGNRIILSHRLESSGLRKGLVGKAGEVTPTRHIPFYPVLYGIGICCFFQSLVLFCDILKIFGREDG
jgi:hypothetical protein